KIWQEPIYRNVWGLLREFGDAEVLSLYEGRQVVVEYARYVRWDGPRTVKDRGGAAPGKLSQPSFQDFVREIKRWRTLVGAEEGGQGKRGVIVVRADPSDPNPLPNVLALRYFLKQLLQVFDVSDVL